MRQYVCDVREYNVEKFVNACNVDSMWNAVIFVHSITEWKKKRCNRLLWTLFDVIQFDCYYFYFYCSIRSFSLVFGNIYFGLNFINLPFLFRSSASLSSLSFGFSYIFNLIGDMIATHILRTTELDSEIIFCASNHLIRSWKFWQCHIFTFIPIRRIFHVSHERTRYYTYYLQYMCFDDFEISQN